MPPPSCKHSPFVTDVSPHALDVNFTRASSPQRAAATTLHGNIKTAQAQGADVPGEHTFPAPLVLPGDALSIDPGYPTQSVRSWYNNKYRNPLKPARRTIYFAAVPDCAPDATFVRDWATIQNAGGTGTVRTAPASLFEGTYEYLKAFYHGMEVKRFHGPLRFVNLAKSSQSAPAPKGKSRSGTKQLRISDTRIGLEFGIPLSASPEDRYVLDIRSRVSPHEASPTYPRQLNLDDLLDAAIQMLPADAYALLLLVDHDIYEDDDDDFACGRAYGGSRVAVVSTARYNPALDATVDWLDREHAWPASHCRQFVQEMCEEAAETKPAKKKAKTTAKSQASKKAANSKSSSKTPISHALAAFRKTFLATTDTPASQTRLWLSRVCKTASHELGHCMGWDHCVYYACIMQGTAGLAEDSRQPPYLCPVDLAKMTIATGGNVRGRYERLLEFCEREECKGEGMFAAFAEWIRRVLEGMEEVEEGGDDDRDEEMRDVIVID